MLFKASLQFVSILSLPLLLMGKLKYTQLNTLESWNFRSGCLNKPNLFNFRWGIRCLVWNQGSWYHMNNSTSFRTWLPVFRPQTNLFSWNHKKKSAQSSSVYCYCSPVMREKNKKHTKKALTKPRWENCRVAETVVFLFLKALLKCICAWNQGPAWSQFSRDFNSYSFLHPISDRCQLFELPPPLPFSFPLLFLYRLTTSYSFIPPPTLPGSQMSSWERNVITTGEWVQLQE